MVLKLVSPALTSIWSSRFEYLNAVFHNSAWMLNGNLQINFHIKPIKKLFSIASNVSANYLGIQTWHCLNILVFLHTPQTIHQQVLVALPPNRLSILALPPSTTSSSNNHLSPKLLPCLLLPVSTPALHCIHYSHNSKTASQE